MGGECGGSDDLAQAVLFGSAVVDFVGRLALRRERFWAGHQVHWARQDGERQFRGEWGTQFQLWGCGLYVVFLLVLDQGGQVGDGLLG